MMGKHTFNISVMCIFDFFQGTTYQKGGIFGQKLPFFYKQCSFPIEYDGWLCYVTLEWSN